MMAGVAEKSVAVALLVFVWCVNGSTQTAQTLPEVDAYVNLSSELRISFQAKQTREAGDPVQAEIGPSLNFYLKPWIRLKNVTAFDLNEAKARPLVFSVGYRVLPRANGAPTTNRMEPVVTFNFPMKGGFLMSDSNRADLDWETGIFSWRYRNRFQIQRTLTLRSYHPSPYASVELFYQSQYGKWSDTAVYAGCIFPIGKHTELDPYYEHQNLTGLSPNHQLNQAGLILNLYFSIR